MSTTAQDIVTLATLRSQLNDPALVPSPTIFKAIGIYERQAYLRAARLDPEYFGTSADTSIRSTYTASWNISITPGNIAAVTSAVVKAIVGTVTGISVGTSLNMVKLRFPDLEPAPRIYIRGRQIFGYLTELGAADANMVSQLTINYAPIPVAPTSGSSVMTIPDEWIDLVILPVAKLMCLRDRRPEDAQALDAELKETYALFEQSVLLYDHGSKRPLPSVPALPLSSGAQNG
jgi:hypothetical protein